MKMKVLAAIGVAVAICGAAWAQPITPPPPTSLPDDAPASDLLPELVTHSRHVATLENGRLSGEGAEFLRELGRNSNFVMLGEDHGNSGIADFATAYWRDLNALGYQYAAIEVDPYVAEAAERELRAGGVTQWGRFLAAQGTGVMGAPFLNWTPEANLADAVVHMSRARHEPALWGVDQVFIGAAPWMLRDIGANARGAEARRLAAQLGADAAQQPESFDWFARLDIAQLQELCAALTGRRDAKYAEMVDAMIVSHRIYQAFTTGAGEPYLANLERETLMKRAFQAHYEAAMRADGAPPRVMLKFGAYHMMRGATPTWVQGMGGFVTEYATAHSMGAVTINVWCGPGAAIGGMGGPAIMCDGPVAETFPFLNDAIDPQRVTIFDLRAWRLRPRRWAHLSADMQSMIGSYDVLVFVPNGPASAFLPELPPPPAQPPG